MELPLARRTSTDRRSSLAKNSSPLVDGQQLDQDNWPPARRASTDCRSFLVARNSSPLVDGQQLDQDNWPTRRASTGRGSSLVAKNSSPLVDVQQLDEDKNWVGFPSLNEFKDTMQKVDHEDHDDDNSSIPIGSDVDLGVPLTDEEEFSGGQNLDSELVDDLKSLERMKELLGREVSRRTAKKLSRPPEPNSSCGSDGHADSSSSSIQSEVLKCPSSRRKSLLHSSRSSGMTASISSMDEEKPRKSKKSRDKKKKKKKKSSKSRKEDDDDADDDGNPTYLALDNIHDSGEINPDGSMRFGKLDQDDVPGQPDSLSRMLNQPLKGTANRSRDSQGREVPAHKN